MPGKLRELAAPHDGARHTIHTLVKRVVESPSGHPEIPAVSRLMNAATNPEAAHEVMASIIHSIDHCANDPEVVLNALKLIYILLELGHDLWFQIAREYIREIEMVRFLTFGKPQEPKRVDIHGLAISLYLHLTRGDDLPLPITIQLEEIVKCPLQNRQKGGIEMEDMIEWNPIPKEPDDPDLLDFPIRETYVSDGSKKPFPNPLISDSDVDGLLGKRTEDSFLWKPTMEPSAVKSQPVLTPDLLDIMSPLSPGQNDGQGIRMWRTQDLFEPIELPPDDLDSLGEAKHASFEPIEGSSSSDIRRTADLFEPISPRASIDTDSQGRTVHFRTGSEMFEPIDGLSGNVFGSGSDDLFRKISSTSSAGMFELIDPCEYENAESGIYMARIRGSGLRSSDMFEPISMTAEDEVERVEVGEMVMIPPSDPDGKEDLLVFDT
jgi:hypothetical protein